MTVHRFDAEGQSIVETLRHALADAEAGNVTALAICAARRDGTTGRAFCPGDGVLSLLGEITVLKYLVLEHLREINDGTLL